MVRLDKLLVDLQIGTRSEVKALLKKGLIFVDDKVIKAPETKVDETRVIITYAGREYSYKPFCYYLMNKPQGVITATEDNKEATVMDIFREKFPQAPKDVSPVGRLDKDTTGLLLLTNDGQLAHSLLSPKKHVDKTYFVTLDGILTLENIHALENGVHIGEGELTAPAKVEYTEGETVCLITIHEGKFHQVKRMFYSVGRQVIALKRISFGPWKLDEEALPLGEVIEIPQC
ncbi:MAG: rRNA pseudouridine synthase [Pseudobutyrivibrio sp.]|nr:rRNA pseudouridine synthase [Pseudobutyrivibrio sp.]